MKKKKLILRHLKEDEEDEEKAIDTYGEREEELREHPKLRITIKGIKKDERDHKKKLRIVRKKVK